MLRVIERTCKMDNYKGFATMYDELMTNVPYDKWGTYICDVLEKQNFVEKHPIVLDLACGTGTMTVLLAEKGYDMIGVDASVDMLASAQQKAYEKNFQILFLCQDMRNLDLFGTIDAAICVCDGLNYILEQDELQKVFERVRLFLNSGGVFIFDMNTEYKFKELLGNRSFEGEAESGSSYEMDNKYDEITKINEYHVVFYENDAKSHFSETHTQRAYDTGSIIQMLHDAGFNDVAVNHDYSTKPPKPDSPRLTFVAKVRTCVQ